MTVEEAKVRIETLRTQLAEHSRRYYVDNAPVISDYDFDQLMHELESLEASFPQFADADSPTLRVGSDLSDSPRHEFRQVAHRYPMLSLGNTYSIEEIEAFASRADKTLEGAEFSYSCELKFDGTAICLEYRKGKLFRALTRGDGTMGDDVTANVLKIKNVPTVLHGDYPEEFEIRGEILMPFEAFDRLNAERELKEEAPFANPRNAASGSIKLLDPKEVAHRGLMATLYHIPDGILDYKTHSEALDAAKSWGLPVSDERRICRNIEEIENYISHWDTARKTLPFATDGIVIKINERDCQTTLGYTAKSPRWAVAYKFKAEQALTELKSIDYQVGRTGAVTPVANLTPVLLSGTMVKRATLNNADQMAQMDIRVGDWVYVEKGGEIIPKITGIELSKRPADSEPTVFPAVCPVCGTQLVREEDEAKWFCPNSDGCAPQIQGRIIHFLSRKAMNILAGEATVEQLHSLGFVKSPADLYDLDKLRLVSLEGWKDRAAQRFLDSLAESRAVSFERVLFALGIRFVGETTAKTLARHFGDIDAIAVADMEALQAVPDIGTVIAKSVYDFFRNEEHLAEIERLKAHGLQFSLKSSAVEKTDVLAGMTIVISGNFSISRDAMKELIENNGGKNSGSVSGKTSFLLAGEKPGPEKIKKAESLGVKIISEKEFMGMLPDAPQIVEQEELTLF